MGKGNRTRNSQYQDAYAMSGAGAAKRQPQKKDRTSTFVLIAIAALLVLSLILVVFSDSGVKQRSTVIVSSENYDVTGTMLAYFEGAAYTNLFSQYYNLYYSYYYSGDAASAYAMAQQAMSQYTLDDFFDSALATVKELLVLGDAAKAANLTLDEEDLASIQETIDSIGGNYTANFGSGVKEKDVRRALELQTLAGKYYDLYVENTLDSITDEEIAKYIEDNKANFYSAHALKLALTLNAEDYADDEAAFEEAKALADTYVAKLEAATTVDEFRTAVVEYLVERDFDSTVTAKVPLNLMPEADALATHKQAIVEKLVDILVEGKEEGEVLYEDGTLEKALATVADTLESTCATALASLEVSQNYVEGSTDEAVLWLINAETAVGATKSVDASDDTKYSRTVYMLTEALHVESEETVNAGHILIAANKSTATEAELAAAKEKAEQLLATYLAGEQTKEAFEKLAKANTSDSGIFYDNITEGQLITEFNDWIFSEERSEIGETTIVQTAYGYHVIYWDGEGDTTSVASAKNGIVSERYEAYIAEGEKALTVNEKYVAKHTAETETETN